MTNIFFPNDFLGKHVKRMFRHVTRVILYDCAGVLSRKKAKREKFFLSHMFIGCGEDSFGSAKKNIDRE